MKWTKRAGVVFLILALAITAGTVPVFADDSSIIWGPQEGTSWQYGDDGTPSQGYQRFGAKINGSYVTGTTGRWIINVNLSTYMMSIGDHTYGSNGGTTEDIFWRLYEIENYTEYTIYVSINIKTNGESGTTTQLLHTRPGKYMEIRSPASDSVVQVNTNINATATLLEDEKPTIQAVYISAIQKGSTSQENKLRLIQKWEMPSGIGGGGVWTQEQITTLLTKLDTANQNQEEIKALLEEIKEEQNGTAEAKAEMESTTETITETNETLSESVQTVTTAEETLTETASQNITAIEPNTYYENIPSQMHYAIHFVTQFYENTIMLTPLSNTIGVLLILGLAAYIIGRQK